MPPISLPRRRGSTPPDDRRTAGSRPCGRGCERSAAVGGRVGMSRSASASATAAAARSPASQRYQRWRSWRAAARAGWAAGSTPVDGGSSELDRQPVLPDQDGCLGGANVELGSIDRRGLRRIADALPQLDRPQVMAMGVQPGIDQLGGTTGLDRGGQRAPVVAGGIPVIRQLLGRRSRPAARPAQCAIGGSRLEGQREPSMAAGPLAREQVAVDDLLEQGVAEHEMRVGRAARRDEDPPVDDLAECRSNHRRRQLGHGRLTSSSSIRAPAAEATRSTSWPASDTAATRASTTSRRRGGRTPSLVSRAAARTCSA